MSSAHSISVVVPIYNERQALPGAIEEIDRFLEREIADYEIIVVESGSTDGSSEACDALPARLPCVRVFHEGRRNGFGSAVRAGAGLATKRWIWPIVVDMPFRLESLVGALPHLSECRAVLSYRSDDPRPVYRRVQSAAFNVLARLLLGVRTRHVNSAFKLVETRLWRSLDLRQAGWLLDAELIMRLQQRGIKYCEIPVAVIERTAGRSSVGPLTGVMVFRDLLHLASDRWRGSRAREDADLTP